MQRLREGVRRAELVFLGTGASGGTPGRGRSARRESSLLVRDGQVRILLDATRAFAEQAEHIDGPLDAVLLTHAHRDACGGLSQLSRWALARGQVVPVLAHPAVIRVARERWRTLAGCRLVAVAAGRPRALARGWRASAVVVPHAIDPRYPTYAWGLRCGRTRIVYASDVARLPASLRGFASGADVLVIDGAMWRSRLFSHLTIDEALPILCTWRVGSILLTQIGRTAPPHASLGRRVHALCPRARPAHDGLVVPLSPHSR